MAPRGNSICLAKKLEILAAIEEIEESGKTINSTVLGRKFDVVRTTIRRISARRNELKEQARKGNMSLKRKRPIKGEDIDAALHLWVVQQLALNETTCLSNRLLHMKAMELTAQFGHGFVPTASWINRFKERHGLKSKTIKEGFCIKLREMPVEIMEDELEAMYKTALEVAEMSGQMIRDTFYKEKKVNMKECIADLVTETDVAIEKEVHSLIAAKFPHHKFIGEETVSANGHCELTDEPTWIIDPIDGTTNFIHSIPDVAFSLGITINKEPIIAVVYVPVREELFTARVGQGAFLNGIRLNVGNTSDLKSSVVLTESGSSRDEAVVDFKMKNIQSVVQRSAGIRCYGSAAVNMCNIAAGRGEANYEFGIHIWDFIAAALVLMEAGGIVLDTAGGKINWMNRRILGACTSSLAKELSTLLTQRDMGSD